MPPSPVPPANLESLIAPQTTRKGQASAATKEGKAAQRARNAGTTTTTRAGSSGKMIAASKYPMLDWATVENEVEWVTDLAGVISHSQVGASGNAIASVGVPLAYAHALLDAHLASRDGMVYFRVYTVSIDKFVERLKADEEAEARLAIQHVQDTGVQQAIEQWLDYSTIET